MKDDAPVLDELVKSGTGLGPLVVGEPIAQEGTVVVPLMRVVIEEERGHTRRLVAEPVGYVEVGPDGAAFEPIVPPTSPAGVLTTLVSAIDRVWALLRRR